MLTLSHLRSKLRNGGVAVESGHLSADVAAAFVERTLSPATRREALQHLSVCEDCRAVLFLQTPARTPAPAAVPPAKVVWGSLAAACVIVCAGGVFLKTPVSSPLPEKLKPTLVAASRSNATKQYVPELLVKSLHPKKKLEWRVDRSRPIHVLQVSNDGSITWSTVPVPRFEPDAVATDGNRVWVANSHRSVMESLDNGAHWAPVKTKISTTTPPANQNENSNPKEFVWK